MSSVPGLLRVELSRRRALGEPFALAWMFAVRRVLRDVPEDLERRAWEGAFEATADAWQAAYEGREPGQGVLAVLALEAEAQEVG